MSKLDSSIGGSISPEEINSSIGGSSAEEEIKEIAREVVNG